MHGLVNRAIQCFIRDTYGTPIWEEIARASDAPVAGFEAMFVYEDAVTDRMLDAAETVLQRPRETVLEDLGTYLVSHPNVEALRRLLRFGGETFLDFLHTIDDLPRRAALAVPELVLPELSVVDAGCNRVRIGCHGDRVGFGYVLVGILRTLADDYGALALLEYEGDGASEEWISVDILNAEHTRGRPFQLAARI
ncbi:MAG: heme NO-binding domain-containing protein [Rhodobacteraceae bacterium]|nr:heme NO-binding domain-containing protein [Paracoccaceae bacterium]